MYFEQPRFNINYHRHSHFFFHFFPEFKRVRVPLSIPNEVIPIVRDWILTPSRREVESIYGETLEAGGTEEGEDGGLREGVGGEGEGG